VLAFALSHGAAAAAFQCTFESGNVVETRYACEPAMVDRFGKRLLELYPPVLQINTSPDYIMGLYTFAMAGCSGHFATMTPQQIGEGGEPFFPRDMLAAMITAAREVICPEPAREPLPVR
jgi:hypothetical protein